MNTQTKSVLTLLIALALGYSSSFAKGGAGGVISSHPKIATLNSYALMNANNVTSWVRNDGFFSSKIAQSFNGEFPRSSGVGMVYCEGIVFGGIVNDSLYSQVIRVTGDTYFVGMQPGRILTNASGTTTGSEDISAATNRTYAVRPDLSPVLQGDTVQWPDLTIDAATFLQKSSGDVTNSDKALIAGQYFADWNQWPAAKGAPWFIDTEKVVRNDAAFDPANHHHIPGIPDAAKTIWFVCNDLNESVSTIFAGSPPMGMEEQMTLWAYTSPAALGNSIYKQVKLIFKGNPGAPPTTKIDSFYMAQWSDIDVGDSGNDFAGSDSVLNLGFGFNATATDAKYAAQGLAVPAVGYAFLQGGSYYTGNVSDSAVVNFQWKKGYTYWHKRPLTAFEYFGSDLPYSDPDDGVYDGAQQWYNLMRGCLPRPQYPAGIPFYTISTYATGHGITTPYCLSGDPVTGQGWVDGIDVGSGDRRIVCSHGPVTLNLHDTLEVVIALVDGMGSNNISSVQILKYNTTYAKYAYDCQSIATGVEQEKLPRSVSISQNFPNPFNPTTVISYQLPVASRVRLTVYDLLGRKVVSLVDGIKPAGDYRVTWDASAFSSGVYFYRVEAMPASGNGELFSNVKKMVLVK